MVGFVVSFLGSIPLGYLNLIGFEIFIKKGFQSTTEYLFGVVVIEVFVIYFTLKFADFLTQQKKWTKAIDFFTILFLLVLSASFFIDSKSETKTTAYLSYFPFFTGLILSSLNFIQIPFWTSWNLYLIHNKYITIEKTALYFYVVATLFGTFFGMLMLILGLNYFFEKASFLNPHFISKAIPVVFFGLAIYQMVQFYRKYYGVKIQK